MNWVVHELNWIDQSEKNEWIDLNWIYEIVNSNPRGVVDAHAGFEP